MPKQIIRLDSAGVGIASGVGRHFPTVCTYDFWGPKSKFKKNTSLFQSNI